MMMTLTGFFITVPNALTLLCLVFGFALIQIQVRLEEEFIAKRRGEKYAEYCRQVRRWL
jgi:protein-S-isoprenylcysteine O-methyltransferase Ste14